MVADLLYSTANLRLISTKKLFLFIQISFDIDEVVIIVIVNITCLENNCISYA
jgi:hypothetical protein